MCEECRAARDNPEHRVFNPACLWCGARYFQMLKAWPSPRDMAGSNGTSRPETTAERQDWRANVLRKWSQFGHSVDRMKELAAGEAVPIAPRGKRNG